MPPPAPSPSSPVSPWRQQLGGAGGRLFLLSFIALFLELMVIRWVPSEVRLVAYYANLMLVSSFLGLGCGAAFSDRGWNLIRWLPGLVTVGVLGLVFTGRLSLPVNPGEWRFEWQSNPALGYALLITIFAFNAFMFVPIGEEIGRQFRRIPNLAAYAWDLGGSLMGTLVFGAFSILHFSPFWGMAVVMVLLWAVCPASTRRSGALCFAITLAAVAWAQRPGSLWSPYYFITTQERHLTWETAPDGTVTAIAVEDHPATTPPAALRTMLDPPHYVVSVNQDFYQLHGTLDPSRFSTDSPSHDFAVDLKAQYSLPYQLRPGIREVLVLGAGGGMDIEAALLHGAQRIDAVDIDPIIPRLSNRFNAAAPYEDPRVTLHVADARAFLQQGERTYDLVIFGFLDSQALSSYGASLRLDGYTYTVESFRQAYSKVADGGMLTVCFFAGQDWLAQKLEQMAALATGRPPIVYVSEGKVILSVPKGSYPPVPMSLDGWRLKVNPEPTAVDLATDDWPYLYLEKQSIPRDYLIVIGVLVVGSLLVFGRLRRARFGLVDGHFLFLGWGFLLLQTKSISDCALYFGSTWLVTTLVIIGILLMVILANAVALFRPRPFSLQLYAPLFLALLLLLLVPREWVLGQSMEFRVGWTLVIVPLPVFFAGLIFSRSFKDATNPGALFGANLIGATLGGFCEYLGMLTGNHSLHFILLLAYGASLLCRLLLVQRRPA